MPLNIKATDAHRKASVAFFCYRINMKKNYYFNPEYAETFGIEEAVMIQHLSFWISKNKKEGRNFHENRYWTYNSCKKFSIEAFPFWSARKIHRILGSLIRKGVILRGNFNRHRYDRISWYAFVNEVEFLTVELIEDTSYPIKSKKKGMGKANTKIDQSNVQNQEMDLSNIVNPIPQNVGTIPDVNTDINTNANTDKSRENETVAGGAVKYLREAWGRKLVPLEEITLIEMTQRYGFDKVKYAIDESVTHNVTKIAYLNGILSPKQNRKRTESVMEKTGAQNVARGSNKKNSGLVTFECTENNCGYAIVHQREQLMKAIELSKPIPCDKCGKMYPAQFILENAKS